jgi:hypothetical protein
MLHVYVEGDGFNERGSLLLMAKPAKWKSFVSSFHVVQLRLVLVSPAPFRTCQRIRSAP